MEQYNNSLMHWFLLFGGASLRRARSWAGLGLGFWVNPKARALSPATLKPMKPLIPKFLNSENPKPSQAALQSEVQP